MPAKITACSHCKSVHLQAANKVCLVATRTTKCTRNQRLSGSNPTHSTLPKKKGNKHLSPTNSPPFPPPAGTEPVAKAKFPWHFTTTVSTLSETETSKGKKNRASHFATETRELNPRELSRRLLSPCRDAPPARSGPPARAGRLHPGAQPARLASLQANPARHGPRGKRLHSASPRPPKKKRTNKNAASARPGARREGSPVSAGSLRRCGGGEGADGQGSPTSGAGRATGGGDHRQ